MNELYKREKSATAEWVFLASERTRVQFFLSHASPSGPASFLLFLDFQIFFFLLYNFIHYILRLGYLKSLRAFVKGQACGLHNVFFFIIINRTIYVKE